MKVVIPSYNRADTIGTPTYLGMDVDWTVVVHDETHRQLYIDAGTVPPDRIVATGQPRGLVQSRNWIDAEWAEPGKWYLSMDDNVRGVFMAPEPQYWMDQAPPLDAPWQESHGRQLIANHMLNIVGPQRFLQAVQETCDEADHRGARLAGFNHNLNPGSWRYKWQDVKYIAGKAYLQQQGAVLPLDRDYSAHEDGARTAQHLLEHGRVLCNNYVIARAGTRLDANPHMELGGLGKLEQRLPAMYADAERLVTEYPGLFRYFNRTHTPPRSEARLAVRTLEQVAAWRHRMLYQQELSL